MLTAIILTAAIVIAGMIYTLWKLVQIYKEYKNRISKEYEAYCKYNELTKCYETCCNYCLVKSECDCCCGGNCKACGGYTLRKKVQL